MFMKLPPTPAQNCLAVQSRKTSESECSQALLWSCREADWISTAARHRSGGGLALPGTVSKKSLVWLTSLPSAKLQLSSGCPSAFCTVNLLPTPRLAEHDQDRSEAALPASLPDTEAIPSLAEPAQAFGYKFLVHKESSRLSV